uniref:Reverse transcriptase Ty1/copia-type domain-containing protein n=1 Tax=Fagus sylvatica TaxID=28930 RepID=A0A2N9FE34_FAGSY
MMGEDGKTSQIEKFDSTDFGRRNLIKKEDAEWALLDRQVLGVIRLTLSRLVAHNVVKETTTMGLMTALSGMYEKSSTNNKVHLMKKLFNLKMVEGAAVVKHLNEFNTITNQLSSVEIEFDEEIYALIVLTSLPNSWEAMRMAVSNSAGKGKLKYDDIRDLILKRGSSQERCMHRQCRRSSFCQQKNRGRSRNKWCNDRATFNDRKELTEDKDHKYDDEKGTTAVVNDEDVAVLSVQEQKCEHVDNIDDEWVVDSAATHHVVVVVHHVQSRRLGYLMLKNVRHVPDLCFNLISTPVMDRAGYCNHLGNGRWKLTKGPMVVARGRICYRLVQDSCEDLVTDGGAICDEECRDGKPATCDEDEMKDSKDLEQGERAPTLEMVEPHEKRSIGECRKDNFKNIWSSDEGKPENWIKDIQGEINYLRMKGIDIDEVFSLWVKMMKKLELRASPADMDSN